MEADLTWRALEEPDPASSPSPSSRPPDQPGGAQDGGRGRWQAPLIVAGTIGAMAVVLAVTVALSPATPGLTLPGDTATGKPAGGAATPKMATSRAGGAVASAAQIVVDVAGAVAHPGIYRLPPGARVADALVAAGGYGPRVDVLAAGRLNLAEPLKDGEQVLVPSRDDGTAARPGPSAATGGGSPAAPAAVDLNHATEAELDALPGIGPATVRKIIDSRTAAAFTAVDDLRTRKLVSEATFSKLAGLVTVGQ